MDTFFIALIAVGVLLLAAVPGFLFIKTKLVNESFISGVSKILVYISQPAIAIYTFAGIDFSRQVLCDMGLFALLTFAVHGVMLLAVYLVLRQRYEQAVYRIITIATTFSNCTFFGIPIIEALLPDIASEVVVYAAVYSLVMNIIGWTVGAAIISRDTKFISLKKIFLNPAMLGTGAAFIIFAFSIPIGQELLGIITTMGKMATPLSMIVLGMRIATVQPKPLFCDVRLYLSSALKQIAMPLVAFASLYFLPIDTGLKCVFYILTACPTASVVLNYSEILGEGQKEASSALLLSTITSIATLPIMVLLMQFLR